MTEEIECSCRVENKQQKTKMCYLVGLLLSSYTRDVRKSSCSNQKQLTIQL